MNIERALKETLSELEGLEIREAGSAFQVKWKNRFGALVHKDSNENYAQVLHEANPYNPVEEQVAWTKLQEWLVKNVR